MPPWRGGSLSFWMLLLPLSALTVLLTAPPQWRLYSILVSSTTYCLMQALLPDCRFRTDRYLCPLNWALLFFLIKLAIAPALLLLTGPAQGTLPRLPDRTSIECALLLETLAYAAFCVALRFVKGEPKSTRPKPAAGLLEGTPGLRTIAVFAAVGLIGFLAAFGTLGNFIQYFSNPSLLSELGDDMEGSWRALAGTVLRPFVAFALVLLWCRRVSRQPPADSETGVFVTTILVGCGIIVANSTFGFNRAAFVFPLVTLAAVFVAKVRRIPPLVFSSVAAALVIPVLLIGAYRANANDAKSALADAVAADELSEQVQTYASAPQFSAYLLDRTGWGRSPYWGRTLLASALHVVPVLGKRFRESSGVAVYNRLIYGNAGIEDQIIPLQGELFLNFHAAGVAAGYFALGLLIGACQRRFETAASPFAAYAIHYVALWAAMMIVWSLAIFSQILVYFCWPIYSYAAWNWTRGWASDAAARRMQPGLRWRERHAGWPA